VEAVNSTPARRIEWTGAGGDYYLAIVVDEHSEVAEEFWGAKEDVRAWIAARPQMNATFVPMALGATRKRARRKASIAPPPLTRP
jgi:hypothetical protein